MELKSGTNEVTVQGNVKTIDDYLAIKKAVSALVDKGSNQISLVLVDSISMPSAVIGYFVKLINHDKVRVTMQVGNPRLYELIDELNLTALFNVRQKTFTF